MGWKIIGCEHDKVDSSWSLLSLSKNDPKLYSNFEFYDTKIHKHLKKHMNGASGEKMGDIEKIIVKTLLKI